MSGNDDDDESEMIIFGDAINVYFCKMEKVSCWCVDAIQFIVTRAVDLPLHAVYAIPYNNI